MKIIGAVDIGGTKIAVGAVREDGTIAYRTECATEPGRGFQDAMQRIQRMLHEVTAACGVLDGIGLACPGPLDPLTGTLGEIGTLAGWQGRNLIQDLQSEFGVTVAVENDADAAALAEFKWGVARTAKSFIYITISTGIGGGMILNGDVYRGAGGAHPEFGHQIIESSGPVCYCTARGCWESLASGTAMSTRMCEMAPGSSPVTAEDICKLARQGNELALRAVSRQKYYLGLGLANLVTLFVPDVIALGGGVMKSSSLFLDDTVSMVRKLCTQVPVEKTSIVLSGLGSDTGLLGAAQSWLYRYQTIS